MVDALAMLYTHAVCLQEQRSDVFQLSFLEMSVSWIHLLQKSSHTFCIYSNTVVQCVGCQHCSCVFFMYLYQNLQKIYIKSTIDDF